MVNTTEDNRKIEDMKGWKKDVKEKSQYGIREALDFGTKDYPYFIAKKFCDIPKDTYEQLVAEAKVAKYDPYFSFNFAYVDHPWAQQIVEAYPEIYGCLYLKINAGENVLPHRDPVRNSSIICPLCLEDETYMPLEIYNEHNIYTIGKKEAGSAWAWDCRLVHSIFNLYHKDRVNLQFNINIPYIDFYNKYLNEQNIS
jgi:hypothetical protein